MKEQGAEQVLHVWIQVLAMCLRNLSFREGEASHFDNSVEFFYNHATDSISQLRRKGFFMKEYTTEFLRNIALVSHGGAGKTMLAEAFLHATGAITRLGKVEDETT